jgi:hypothetical protein
MVVSVASLMQHGKSEFGKKVGLGPAVRPSGRARMRMHEQKNRDACGHQRDAVPSQWGETRVPGTRNSVLLL